MISSGPSRPRTGLAGAWLLLGLACVLYLVMMGNIAEPASTDPNTRGIVEALREVGNVLFTLMLWIVLATLLLAGGVAGEMRIVAASLLLLSGVAVICAGFLSLRYHGWAIVVATSLPPLIALYAMWARLPVLHAALSARVVNVCRREVERGELNSAIAGVGRGNGRAQRRLCQRQSRQAISTSLCRLLDRSASRRPAAFGPTFD
jgi:hypothetical protein